MMYIINYNYILLLDISSEYAQIRSNNALGRTLRLYMEVGVAKKQSFPTCKEILFIIL